MRTSDRRDRHVQDQVQRSERGRRGVWRRGRRGLAGQRGVKVWGQLELIDRDGTRGIAHRHVARVCGELHGCGRLVQVVRVARELTPADRKGERHSRVGVCGRGGDFEYGSG
jgi:hypothetical protein